MLDDELTPTERAVLLVLMTEQREIGNTELFERYGFKISQAVRERLEGMKLLDVRKSGSAFLHQVNDDGWARGGTELRADFAVPARPPKVQVAAWKALALATGRYLDVTGTKPSDFFAPQQASVESVAPPTADLESRIRDAYRQVAQRPNQSVALSKLRRHLDGTDPVEVDKTLVRMFADGLINLTPGANQKERREADEQAAVRTGGETKHFVSMET